MTYNLDLVTMVVMMVFASNFLVPRLHASKHWPIWYLLVVLAFGLRSLIFNPFDFSEFEKFVRGCANGLTAIAIGSAYGWWLRRRALSKK